MRIIVDVMSGDNAPFEPIKGAIEAAQSCKAEIAMVGNENIIRNTIDELNLSIPENITIEHSEGVVTMEDAPLCVVREKAGSSMGKALSMLAEGKGDALISAGNTGALHAGSTLVVRRVKGIKRSAIATILPFQNPTLLIDSGANTEVTKEHLEQFGIMGSIYMNKLYGIEKPRVGLANIGTESTKGTKELVEAYEYLKNSEHINFIGNIEGKQIPFGECDVLVCNGLIGNIILKTSEGVAKFVMKKIKSVFLSNALTKVSALLVKSKLKELKSSMSASEYGGAPMLGISKPVIKAHGSSKAEDIKNAVHQAISFINTGIIVDISKAVSKKGGESNE
ncbi:MAG: phosphate acyltransferase PlsX [Clostridia bacterium]|nr:phosphate acyltransferase PlsX [Clostridia bacterium]